MTDKFRFQIRFWIIFSLLFLLFTGGLFHPARAQQQYEARAFSEIKWRSIGPFRGGRTRAVAGVPSQPNVFYMA
ncbi:MAG: hypothetical protein ABJA66_12315, partial [Actinomycetota bacterium]